MSNNIHGYVKLTITESEREYLKNWLQIRKDWANSFVIGEEEKGWWIFKYTRPVYRTDEPPEGLHIYEYNNRKYVDTSDTFTILTGIYRLYKHNTTAHISSDWVHTFNLFIRGK